MRRIILLSMGLVLCLSLYGCGGDDPAADGEQAVSLQDMAMDMSKEGDVLPEGTKEELSGDAQRESLPDSAQGENTSAAGEVHNRNLEEIKNYLAQYPDSLQELSAEECYIVLHGEEYGGREYLDSFMAKVQKEITGELVIVQFTVEGDPILVYLNADAGNVYCVEDASRDAWAGNDEGYFEKTYDSVWLSGEADTEGSFYLTLYALQEQDMIVEVFTAATDQPLMCGLPPADSSGTEQTSPAQAEMESKMPRIEELTVPVNGGGNCIELQELPEWAKPPAP